MIENQNTESAKKYLSNQWIEFLLKNGSPKSDIQVHKVTPFDIDNSASILVNLTSQSSSSFLGHFGLEVNYQKDGALLNQKMVLKVKPHGSEISSMLNGLASLCEEPLASDYKEFLHETGFENTHGRELVIYNDFESPLFPKIYGTCLNDSKDQYFILMECLENSTLLNTVMEPELWDDGRIKQALRSLAKWHSAHLDCELPAPKYWKDTSDDYMSRHKKLWTSLLNNGHHKLPDLYTQPLYQTLTSAIDHLDEYQREMDQFPKTIIHNDANLRNACIADDEFCLYDWELADLHLPQYDVVEWLCFVLDADRYHLRMDYLMFYQEQLNGFTNNQFNNKEEFIRGFELAAMDFGLHRLGMYSMAHSVSPFPFLPRVMASYADTIKNISL